MTKDETLRLALVALEKLWNIIDDIDTYSDMAKADEKLYRSLVERRQRQRFEETGISTDGYELHGGVITAIKAALEAKDEFDWKDMYEKQKRHSEMWVAKYEKDIGPLEKAVPQQEAKDEPVAWLHTKIEGVVVPHRPADLDKHPDRWEALYKTPPSCSTCEALSRTVMLDQTSHDTTPPQRTWVGLTDDERSKIWGELPQTLNEERDACIFAEAIELYLKERNK